MNYHERFPTRIAHIESKYCTQISMILKGTIELSGPKSDYIEFIWRLCCLLAYDITRGFKVGPNFQYMLASLLYNKIASSSYLHAAKDNILGPMMELLCPFEIKGYTEFPIADKNFPRIQTSSDHTVRYSVQGAKQLRIRSRISLRACPFSDNNRDDARARGYIPLEAPDAASYIEFFTFLEDKIAEAGPYFFKDVAAFISSDMEAILPESKTDGPSFMKRIATFVSGKQAIQDKKREKAPEETMALNSLAMMTYAKEHQGTYQFASDEAVASTSSGVAGYFRNFLSPRAGQIPKT